MKKRQATEAQKAKAKERRAKMRELAKRISAMTPEQQAELTKGTICTIEGRPLSPYNQCMIAVQGCQANVVGGFRQWIKAGRSVCKGQHGYGLWVPIARNQDDNGETDPSEKPGFVLGTVFGIDQTEELNQTAPDTAQQIEHSGELEKIHEAERALSV